MKLLFFLLLVFCSFISVLACRSLKGKLATAGREAFLDLLVLSVPERAYSWLMWLLCSCSHLCVCPDKKASGVKRNIKH